MIVYLNGKFVNAKDAKLSVFDPGFLYGDGIFETMRTYNGKIWQINEHLSRLYESARMRGWKLSWKPPELAEVVVKTLNRNLRAHGASDLGESEAGQGRLGAQDDRASGSASARKSELTKREFRIRITITAGVKEPTLFIWVQPQLQLPAAVYEKGVSVITFPLERPFPQMKTISMQPLLIARAEMMRKKAFDALLINRKGCITEGTWTNVFIVKRKTVITPRLGVLLGTTRDIVLKLARPLLRIKQRDIMLRELMNADECFLTNAPKGIIPVVYVDGKKIGNGKVGVIAKHLMEKFEKKVKESPKS